MISLLRSARRVVCHQSLWINTAFSPAGFRPTIRAKPAQAANVGDYEVVIGFVPLLWWSPYCGDVEDKALINLSCK